MPNRFVVHKHEAKKAGLHYDLRIEEGDHLESYACRKGLPLEKDIKRLLIRQPNHDKKWLKFQGTIPDDQFGAGKITIWDSGTYDLIQDKGRVRIFNFHGKKLKGPYIIVKIRGRNNYLIFRRYWQGD